MRRGSGAAGSALVVAVPLRTLMTDILALALRRPPPLEDALRDVVRE
jgi:hypothetical protein